MFPSRRSFTELGQLRRSVLRPRPLHTSSPHPHTEINPQVPSEITIRPVFDIFDAPVRLRRERTGNLQLTQLPSPFTLPLIQPNLHPKPTSPRRASPPRPPTPVVFEGPARPKLAPKRDPSPPRQPQISRLSLPTRPPSTRPDQTIVLEVFDGPSRLSRNRVLPASAKVRITAHISPAEPYLTMFSCRHPAENNPCDHSHARCSRRWRCSASDRITKRNCQENHCTSPKLVGAWPTYHHHLGCDIANCAERLHCNCIVIIPIVVDGIVTIPYPSISGEPDFGTFWVSCL
ncbi:hypothetical protein FA15DRAFT_346678 [Coprinopsis marcescibilis]|uniref:Uncharacterized protein n=1 Tax=Coprinopsis marcescibilis TaxID=230819 RepID=A0A5C3LC07_COPMA|nr:hypothetical protein FA15DRAFT_346678 [Coprinopsis marcescibilis]